MLSFGWKRKAVPQSEANLGRLPMQRAALAMERLSRFRFFSGEDYRALHGDIGPMDPAMHFIAYGADEARVAVRPVQVARILGELRNGPVPARQGDDAAAAPLEIGVYASSHGSAFVKSIAAALVAMLRGIGHHAMAGDENSDIDARPPHCIYIAPQDFFFLGNGPAWVRDEVLADACIWCTQPAQTNGFWRGLHVALMARSVIDTSLPQAAAFAEVMPAACVLPLRAVREARTAPPDHPLLAGQAWWAGREGRPLDLCFFGAASPLRARFLARHAERFSRYESFLYLRNRAGPNESEGLAAVASHVASHARLMLNLHRDEFPGFEWHRIVGQGMANGCAVVSEPCFSQPGFEPGVHYLAEETHRLADLAEWALNDADGRDRVVAVARAGEAVLADPAGERARAAAIAALLRQ